jgi:hypothetical protein
MSPDQSEDASRRPSGEYSTACASLLWPEIVKASWPLCSPISQNLVHDLANRPECQKCRKAGKRPAATLL